MPTPSTPASLWTNTVKICRNRTFILQTAMTSLSLSGFVAYLSTSPTILIGSFGVSEGNFGLLFSVISASFATATFICGRVVTRFGLSPLIGLGAVLCLIGGAMMAGLALNEVDTVPAVVGSMAVYIVGMALILPQAQAAGLQPFPATAGLASSIMGFANAVFASAVSITLNTFPNTDAVPVGVALAASGTLCSAVFFLGIVPNLRKRSRTWTGIKYFLFVLLIGGVSSLNPLAIDAFIPAMPEIAKDLAVDPGTVGITLGLYTLGHRRRPGHLRPAGRPLRPAAHADDRPRHLCRGIHCVRLRNDDHGARAAQNPARRRRRVGPGHRHGNRP